MTQMPEAQIIEQFDTKLMPDINSGDSFLNRAKKLVGYAATAAGLSLGAAVVVDEAYDPVVTFAEGIPPGSHHCAPGEVPYDLMPIADANGDVTWIDICYDTNGGGGSGGSGGSNGGGTGGGGTGGGSNGGGNTVGTPNIPAKPSWPDLKAWFGCADGVGDLNFANQLVQAGLLDPSKRLYEVIASCPSDQWLAIIGTADANVSNTPEQIAALQQHLAELANPPTTLPTVVSTEPAPTSTEVTTTSSEQAATTTVAVTTTLADTIDTITMAETTTAVPVAAEQQSGTGGGESNTDNDIVPPLVIGGVVIAASIGLLIGTRKKRHPTHMQPVA